MLRLYSGYLTFFFFLFSFSTEALILNFSICSEEKVLINTLEKYKFSQNTFRYCSEVFALHSSGRGSVIYPPACTRVQLITACTGRPKILLGFGVRPLQHSSSSSLWENTNPQRRNVPWILCKCHLRPDRIKGRKIQRAAWRLAGYVSKEMWRVTQRLKPPGTLAINTLICVTLFYVMWTIDVNKLLQWHLSLILVHLMQNN